MAVRCAPFPFPIANGDSSTRATASMTTSGWNTSRQASYGSVPFEDDDFGEDDQVLAKRSLLETLFFTHAAPVNDVIQAHNLEADDLFKLEKLNATRT